MDAQGLDVVQLTFRKDGLVAEFTARAPVWHAVQAAALAAVAFGALAVAGRTLSSVSFGILILLAAATWILADSRLSRTRRRFDLELGRLLDEVEKMKSQGGQ